MTPRIKKFVAEKEKEIFNEWWDSLGSNEDPKTRAWAAWSEALSERSQSKREPTEPGRVWMEETSDGQICAQGTGGFIAIGKTPAIALSLLTLEKEAAKRGETTDACLGTLMEHVERSRVQELLLRYGQMVRTPRAQRGHGWADGLAELEDELTRLGHPPSNSISWIT